MPRFVILVSLLAGCEYYATPPSDGADPVDCSAIDVFSDQPAFEAPGTIVGRVTSPSGEVPVVGAQVSITVGSEVAWALSGEQGCFQLQLPAGEHTASVEKNRYRASTTFAIARDRITDVGAIPLDTGDVRLAVVYGQYDDVGSLIDDLGVPHDDYASPADLLGDPATLAEYDVVFANCGSTATATNDGAYLPSHFSTVRTWVEAGGTLYASDWEHVLFEGVAPEALEFREDPHFGLAGELRVTVLDRDLVALLGRDTARINFDLPDWSVIESAGTAMPLVEARLTNGQGTHPLAAIQFSGSGRMIYTSFHNEQQITSDMKLILYELILAL